MIALVEMDHLRQDREVVFEAMFASGKAPATSSARPDWS